MRVCVEVNRTDSLVRVRTTSAPSRPSCELGDRYVPVADHRVPGRLRIIQLDSEVSKGASCCLVHDARAHACLADAGYGTPYGIVEDHAALVTGVAGLAHRFLLLLQLSALSLESI